MSRNVIFLNQTGIYEYPNSMYAFSPSERYPEYAFDEISPENNGIYAAVRNTFYYMGYDKENFGTPFWNPLKEFINPGDTVLLKPNLVMHQNGNAKYGMDCVITNPSIIRVVADYALLALNNTGKLIIGDAPIQECNFEKLVEQQGVNRIRDFYDKYSKCENIELVDFRNYRSMWKNNILESVHNSDDLGVTVNLSNESEFAGLSAERIEKLRITNYPHTIMQEHHNDTKHEYIVSKKLLEADVIINMPKPKTHRFAGVTLSMKNLIGINASKECLPHHSIGSIYDNGDEYKEKNLLKELYAQIVDVRNIYMRNGDSERSKTLREIEEMLMKSIGAENNTVFGGWHGNDTIWRTILDVNKIAFFADKNGVLQDIPQRKMLIIGDMIVSGEESGPLSPTPRKVGVIAVGEDPVCFDEIVCTYMGYNYNKIKTIKNARNISGKYKFNCTEEAVIKSNNTAIDGKKPTELSAELTEHFIPNPVWKEILP